MLTLYFLVESWFRLRSVEIRVDEQFGLANSAAVTSRSALLLPLSVWSPQRSSDGKVDVQLLWGQFKALGTLSNRVLRVGTQFTVLALFGLVMYLLFGESNDPLRGTLNWLIGRLTMLGALTALVLLTLFVVDGTSLVLALVRNLGTGASHYESTSLRLLWARQFTEDGKLPDSDSAADENLHRIQELADVAIIAELASSVFSILLYPFISLTLLILARSTVFDNFVWSTVLVAVYGMLFAYALWCAVALQRTAERVRTNAIAVARRKLDAVRRGTARRSKEAAAVYESSIYQIETAKSGAFMSLYDNPIFRAVLIPTGGTTLITLFEYLSRL